MSKIKKLEKKLRQQKSKRKALFSLKKKRKRLEQIKMNWFILFFSTMLIFPFYLIFYVLLDGGKYIELIGKGLTIAFFITLVTWGLSELIAYFLEKKIEKKNDRINKFYCEEKISLKVDDEELPFYLEELSNMSDEEVNRIPSEIINKIIYKKQELEMKEANKGENTDKLDLIKIRNEKPLMVNN